MDNSLLPLAYLLPIGLALVAWSSVPAAHRRAAAFATGVTIVVSLVAYIGFGFALQFGGIGLSPNAPAGLRSLDMAWSPFPSAVGRWSMIGLEGFFISAEGSSAGLSLVQSLALHRLPMAIVAGLIPILALGDRVNRVAQIASGIVSAAFVFPIAGSWIWGGGWLAMLGLNLNFGHGAIDPGGSGVVFLASGCVALIALRLFGRSDRDDASASFAIHPAVLAVLGVTLFGTGWSAWAISDPLLSNYPGIGFGGAALIGLISAAASTLVDALYGWLVTGRVRLSGRGWIAGWVAASASALFIPQGAAIVVGAGAGILSIWGQVVIERTWKSNDRGGLMAACSMAGAWGLIAPGLFADGVFGAGWNGLAASTGVRGLLASDPGQLSAQVAALAAIGAYAIVSSTLLLFPLAVILRRLPH